VIGALARNAAYQYRVRNGFHRFYLCQKLGFTSIPVDPHDALPTRGPDFGKAVGGE